MTGVRFTKMSGAGNDFIVLDAEGAGAVAPDPVSWTRAVCRRGVSVGADGVLVVAPGAPGRVRVEFRNPDGSVAFCGNGSRCAARFAFLRGWCREQVVLETLVGDVPAEIRGGEVRLTLPPPFDRGARTLEACGRRWLGRAVDAGVPHFVVEVNDVASVPLAEIGPVLRRDPAWGPEGANVDLISRADDGGHRIRTWERGVENETLSCGTGAIAAALALRLAGAPETVRLVPASGLALTVTIVGDPRQPAGSSLAGDARVVFEGTLSSEAL